MKTNQFGSTWFYNSPGHLDGLVIYFITKPSILVSSDMHHALLIPQEEFAYFLDYLVLNISLMK